MLLRNINSMHLMQVQDLLSFMLALFTNARVMQHFIAALKSSEIIAFLHKAEVSFAS